MNAYEDESDQYNMHASEDSMRAAQDMIDDLGVAFRNTDGASTAFDRRTFARTLFAVIEATVNAVGVVVFELSAYAKSPLARGARRVVFPVTFTMAELAMMKAETYRLSDNGKAQATSMGAPFEARLRFAISLVGRLSGDAGPHIDKSDWDKIKQCVRIRNSITHPRVSREMAISDADMALLRDVGMWYLTLWLNIASVLVASVTKVNDDYATEAIRDGGKAGDIVSH
jgi:hypothetical protein